ncbi:hypothetical protein VKS41_002214 [Umbelopsis sp. WA50703]
MSKKSVDNDQRPDNETLSHTNSTATDNQPEATPQFLHHNQIACEEFERNAYDEPDSPVDDSASLFNIDSSVLSSKSLGDSGVIVDHVAEDANDQTTETKDEDHVGNNKLDTSSASSTVSSVNDTPPQPVSTIKLDNAKVPENTDEHLADHSYSQVNSEKDSQTQSKECNDAESIEESDVEADVDSDVNSEADGEETSDEVSDEVSEEESDDNSNTEGHVENDDEAVVPSASSSKTDSPAPPQMKRTESLMDKIKASEAFSAAKSRSTEEQNRPSFEFARHISGEQLQTLLKSVSTKDLMESSDNEAVRETLMHIQQAALDEVQEQEEKKGVVDEMLEAIATSSGVSELAGAIQEQLRSQEVIEEAAERERVGSSDSTILSEDIVPESLKEPEENIIHVDLSSCSSRASLSLDAEDALSDIPDVNAHYSAGSRVVYPSNGRPVLDYDEYWREYGLQFILMLIFTLLAMVMNILMH